jgi:hypothetical protein
MKAIARILALYVNREREAVVSAREQKDVHFAAAEARTDARSITAIVILPPETRAGTPRLLFGFQGG